MKVPSAKKILSDLIHRLRAQDTSEEVIRRELGPQLHLLGADPEKELEKIFSRYR